MAKVAATNDKRYLTLGWHVDKALHPDYWVRESNPAPGSQSDADLVMVPPEAMGCHTAIVAQSGSGKSFFLGRLIEELILKTKAHCVILDPNADFRRFNDVVPNERWENVRYDQRRGRGFLPHERKPTDFSDQWTKVTQRLRGGPALASRLLLDWRSLSMEILADEIEPMLRNELYHCHEFVKAVGLLAGLKRGLGPTKTTTPASSRRSRDLIEETRRIMTRLKTMSTQEKREHLEELYSEVRASPLTGGLLSFLFRSRPREQLVSQQIDIAVAASEYISEQVARYYFGKAGEYLAQGIVQADIIYSERRQTTNPRVDIVDLPSFRDHKSRRLALNSVLTTVWDRARDDWAEAFTKDEKEDERVPTFVIADEAHNLIPDDTDDLGLKALREQFRSIAAEGRKFGLFLILCTQRPDKIDRFVLSECENRAIMRVGSKSVLSQIESLMGLEDLRGKTLDRCLEFGIGRALLAGRWANLSTSGGLYLYTAMRRTAEGGRNLRDAHWAAPLVIVDKPLEATPIGADAEEKVTPAETSPGLTPVPPRKSSRRPKARAERGSTQTGGLPGAG